MTSEATLFSAPHRVMFLGGTVQALLAMTFWALETGGHYAGLWNMPVPPLLTLLPPGSIHALLMGSGVFPWFVFGFILTAGPRWQGAQELRKKDYLPPFLLLAAGWLLVWPAVFVPSLLGVGLTGAVAGWLLVLRLLFRLARQPAQSREHIGYVAMAGGAGCAGLGAFLVPLWGGDVAWLRYSVALTVWGFLLPVFVTVAHRMLPFFSSSVSRDYRVQRPAWALRVLLAASLAHGGLFAADRPEFYWVADVPATVAAAVLSRLWWHRGVRDHRMVLVLHIAFGWLAPAFALSSLSSLFPAIGGQAALHAMTLGFFASMLVGMVSRVTLGHSGKPVAADRTMWAAFCLMQAAALVRVTSGLPVPGAALMVWLSSLCWLTAFGIWAARYAPMLWRPRADGKPG